MMRTFQYKPDKSKSWPWRFNTHSGPLGDGYQQFIYAISRVNEAGVDARIKVKGL